MLVREKVIVAVLTFVLELLGFEANLTKDQGK